MKEEKLDQKNKDFFQNVYDVVRLIPSGRATSYGAIAAYLGRRGGARMVGWALGNSYASGIPAHRVVNREGILTAKLQFETPQTMENLLKSEGIQIKNDKIQNWNECFWDPAKELL